jgi:hypothetical protein
MPTHLISEIAAHRYTSAPAPTTVSAAKSLHESIRCALGNDYETFLQGSYKNGTGVPDLNDVDIVALRKTTYSTVFTSLPPGTPVTWDSIFADVQGRLEGSHHYRGKTERGDKCVKVNTEFKADVVPAVHLGDPAIDPIAIYSFRQARERKNFPRDHYERGKEKQARTADTYKPTVRMFKRWARGWFKGTDTAPSFYVECLVHSLPDTLFTGDPPSSFVLVANHIVNKLTRSSVVMSVAGDKDILTSAEWDPAKFEVLQVQLKKSLMAAALALKSQTSSTADRLWREAFNE